MPLSTVLLTYELGFAGSHLLLGTAVFKWNRALCKRCQAGLRARKPRVEQLGKSVFYSWSPELDHHLQFQIPVILHGSLIAEMHCLKQFLQNPVLQVLANFYEPAKKMSKWKDNEEGCGTCCASSISAQPQGENCTQADSYKIRIHVNFFALLSTSTVQFLFKTHTHAALLVWFSG